LAVALSVPALAYVGYPLWAWLRARLWPRPVARDLTLRPSVTVIIAAWREAGSIAAKLASLAAQDYPAALVEVIVACDGSDDGTDELARTGGAKVLMLPRGGKPSALNAAVAAARGEVIVFTDARQPLWPGSVKALVANLGDPTVGAVGGRLVLEGDAPAGAYWRYEAALRRWEGLAGSTVGVSGALWAVWRSLLSPLPPETILDDVLAPMRVRLKGLRVVYEPDAVAVDRAAESGREFQRKVRTLSGNFQLLALLPSLLVPWRNPSWGDFMWHKLLRLVVPWALLAALGASFALPWPWAPLVAGAQLSGYALAGLRGVGLRLPLSGLAETFVVLNAAAAWGLLRFLRHGRRLPW